MGNFTFRVLGSIDCVNGGQVVQLGRPQQIRLLAVLLVHANRTVSRETLVDSLWGLGSDASGSSNRLPVAVARLRKALAPVGMDGRLTHHAGGYRLQIQRGELDAAAFVERVEHGRRALRAGEPVLAAELLRAALSLWHGAALGDVAAEPFAQPEIRRLEALRQTALAARIDADLELGRHTDVLAELDALVAGHPTHEQFAGQLMTALYRCGRQAEALDVFQRARRWMVEQLGIEPGPSLQAIQAQVLTHDAELLRSCPLQPAAEVLPLERDGRAFLIVGPGLATRRVVPLDPSRQLTVGRDAVADVALIGDRRVSRVHAVLEYVDGDWVVADDGLSRNGTFCNDQRVTGTRTLRDGDLLRVGATLVAFREPAAEQHAATAGTSAAQEAA